MRLTRSIRPTLLVALAACSASLTAPPNGLPVTLTPITNEEVQVPSITSADDSVTAVILPLGVTSCGGALTPAAGLRGDVLVVTLTQAVRKGPCPPVPTAVPLPLEIVVHDVPSGTSSARVVLRLVGGNDTKYSVLVSGAIIIP